MHKQERKIRKVHSISETKVLEIKKFLQGAVNATGVLS